MAFASRDEDDFGLTHNPGIHYGSNKLDPLEYHVPDWLCAMSIVFPKVMLCGFFTNILAFVVLVRSRLWLKHEAYVYLAANFCVNVGILWLCTSSFWFTPVYGTGPYYSPTTSNVICKFRHVLMEFIHAPVWLSVALLFNVYLRKYRIRCGCPMLAAKYCTLSATKNIVTFTFGFLLGSSLTHQAIYEIQFGGAYSASQPGLAEMILMWVLPYVFLPIILLIIYTTVGRKGNKTEFSELEDRSASADQMLVLAVALWCIIQVSQFGLMFLHHNNYEDNVVVCAAIGLAFALSIGLQPILCFVILKTLRDGFRSQLRNINCCRQMFPSLDRDEDVVQLTSIQELAITTVVNLDLHTCTELTSLSKEKAPL